MQDTQVQKHTLGICNTYWFSTAAMVARRRLSVVTCQLPVLLVSKLASSPLRDGGTPDIWVIWNTLFSHMQVDISLTAGLTENVTENRLICNHYTNTQETSGFRRGAGEASALTQRRLVVTDMSWQQWFRLQKVFLDWLALENGTNTLPRNLGNQLPCWIVASSCIVLLFV